MTKDSIRRAVLKERLRTGLMVAGITLFLCGLLCMPGPLVNPKATTSLFAAFAAAGLVIRYGVALMAIGVLLFGSAFLIHRDK